MRSEKLLQCVVMGNEVVTKRGKPFRSVLAPYEEEVQALHVQGMSVRVIAAEMLVRHGVQISHNAVASFLRTHRRARNFLEGLTETRKGELLKALKALWTHDSTAIEGNTLTLGDTMIVLEYGLTVKGKPLRDQQDVAAHGRAVDFIRDLTKVGRLTEEDVLQLHRLTIPVETVDIYRPVGAWKREDNGTYGAEGGWQVYMSYASADDTPALMKAWIRDFNGLYHANMSQDAAFEAYVRAHTSFVRIHPFFDGNGRLARLLANLPVLFAGYPPIVISSESRIDYITALWKYQRQVGVVSKKNPELLPRSELLDEFKSLVRQSWGKTLDLVAEARK